MGRIKTKAIKRTARSLVDKGEELFKEDFESNKKILGNVMPSKRTRNMIAGYITRLKKNNKKILPENG
jgi:ribosomal protein S17E